MRLNGLRKGLILINAIGRKQVSCGGCLKSRLFFIFLLAPVLANASSVSGSK